uniref:Uncharacterized protein n=1 Tax=Pyxicephalus adspersus TaxID=30357 RepID=A0AAV3B582_PYXAD|nr:TPA: hypothetical protein GDO54_000212 [Pyxicephalus adspersus]
MCLPGNVDVSFKDPITAKLQCSPHPFLPGAPPSTFQYPPGCFWVVTKEVGSQYMGCHPSTISFHPFKKKLSTELDGKIQKAGLIYITLQSQEMVFN